MSGDERDVRLVDVHGYMAWSRRYVDALPAFIAHLDATDAWLTPAEAAAGLTEVDLDELLEQVILEAGDEDDLREFRRLQRPTH